MNPSKTIILSLSSVIAFALCNRTKPSIYAYFLSLPKKKHKLYLHPLFSKPQSRPERPRKLDISKVCIKYRLVCSGETCSSAGFRHAPYTTTHYTLTDRCRTCLERGECTIPECEIQKENRPRSQGPCLKCKDMAGKVFHNIDRWDEEDKERKERKKKNDAKACKRRYAVKKSNAAASSETAHAEQTG
jgi:hypothetical protein